MLVFSTLWDNEVMRYLGTLCIVIGFLYKHGMVSEHFL